MTLYLVPIVEGETEKLCIAPLLHRIWRDLLAAPIRLQVLPALTVDRGCMVSTTRTDLTDKVDEACVKLIPMIRTDPINAGLLLILLDADHDCPATLGPSLLHRAKTHRSDVPIACVLAKRMFENWIVAGASTLAGVKGLPDPLSPPPDCEGRSGSKWLGEQLRHQKSNRAYKKTVDAKVFIQRMNLQECRDNAPSFDKLCRDLAARLPPPPDDAPAPEA